MELQHRFVVPASMEETWAAFNDLESIAPCFPGATLTSAEGDDFKGSVKVKLGPISMLYNGTGQFVERDEAGRRAVIEAKGKDKRGNGTASATVVAQLTPDGDGTAVEVSTDLAVTGKPAQFGRGVIQDVSDKLLGQFVECIAGKLGEGEPEAAPSEAPSAAAAPAADSAAGPAPEPAAPPPPSTAATSTGDTTSTGGGAQGRTLAAGEPSELNLMSTVMPVLVRRYAAPVGAAVAMLMVLWLIVRRRRG